MAILAEYALTPDVFDASSYSSGEVCGIRLQMLKEVLLTEGLVGDLRDGQWKRLFQTNDRSWHLYGKELLKKLWQQNRMHIRPSATETEPTTDSMWCHEALRSHGSESLSGIIVSPAMEHEYGPMIASIDRLNTASWWTGRSPSVRLGRTIEAYSEYLQLILHCANSVMIIDPHIDPTQRRYSGLINFLGLAANRIPAPLIEIHRVCYFDTRNRCNQEDEKGWRRMFQPLALPLQENGLSADVFIWDDFHDRYLISNLVGVSIPNGFDTTTDASQQTTWTRLGRNDKDDVQREFDPASKRHELKHRFKL